jgi:signal transduction histidine kinase
VVRAGVDGQLVPPERVVDDHDALVAAMLGATHGLAGQLEGPAPARAARLLLAVAVAKEATGQERTLLATTPPPPGPALAAAAAVARSELNRVRGAAGDRLEEVDRALGTPGVRRLRRLELELLEPAPRPAAVTGDLAHLLAELLNNAAAFSSPAAPISVSAAADGDGYLVEVGDRGLGMTDQELAWANQRLAGRGGAAPAGVAAGDRLGLVVVARLAARNGFGVRLGRSAAGGVTAAVRLPAAALESGSPVPARLL